MADYYSLVVGCIEDVQVKVRDRDGVLLNKHQCRYLAQELLKVSKSLPARGYKRLEGDLQRTVLLHLHATVKRAQVLVAKCCCESSSWLAAAMALGDTKEEVIAILLALRQWSYLLDVFNFGASWGSVGALRSAEVQEFLETGDESYRLSKQQSKMQIAVHDAARQDREELLERIAKHSLAGEEARRDGDFVRGVYLKAQLTHTELGNLQSVEGLKAYTYVGPLGSGAYGMVMKVKWWGQEVALKILQEIERTEATLLGQVQHPNIVRLFHYWEEQSPRPHSCISMELMPGDLLQHIKNVLGKRSAPSPSWEGGDNTGSMPFSLPVAVDTMLQVAQAMRHVHEMKLTHRDLKTSNILVKPVTDEYLELHKEGYMEVKLADFGSSKAYTNSCISGNLTRNIGTSAYGAPEIFEKEQIARKRNYPPKADVWSFGMTCSEILTGKAPFADDTARSTLHKRIVKNGLRPSLPRDCPEYVCFCIARCWELQPERRPNFRDLCRMLKHAKLVSLGLMDVESSKWLFAYQIGAGGPNASVLSLQPQDGSWTSRFGLERVWRNLLGAGVSSTARNALPSDDTSGLYGQNQDVQSLSKVFKLTMNGHFRMPLTVSRPWCGMFTMAELGSATNNFSPSNIIGEGRFGMVYKGRLRDGRLVAIKRKKIDAFDRSFSVEFRTEMKMLSQVDHLNVVKVIGYMEEGSERIVVVEYVSNGNLQEHLDGTCGKVLDTSTRLDIAIDVAHALTYLHLYAERPIILSDIRASNILLTDTYRAKVANLGISRWGPSMVSGATHVSAQVRGTAGYLDPEYLNTYEFYTISDVYSFGILLVVIFTGRRPFQWERPRDEHVTVEWAFDKFVEGKIREILDPKLEWTFDWSIIDRVFELAFACAAPTQVDRPSMKEAAEVLLKVRKDYLDKHHEELKLQSNE